MTSEIDGIWKNHSEILFKYILKHINNYQDAEDLLQEVFLKAHKGLKDFENIESVKSWMYRITKNTIIDYYRKKGKNNFTELTDDIPSEFFDTKVTDEVIECLLSMINHLPEKYKQALILTELGNLTQRQFAEIENLSNSGAKSRVQRARKKLKDMLADCCTYQFDHFGNIINYELKKKDCKYC